MHSKLDSPLAEIMDVFSNFIGDSFISWTVQKLQCINISKKVTSLLLEMVFFAWNPNVLTHVRNVLSENEGMNENEIYLHMCCCIKWWLSLVYRSILPPSSLHYRVRAVFVFHGD